MNGYSTAFRLALALLGGLTVTGCAAYPTQQAQLWDRQYHACYGNAFHGSSQAAAAERQDTKSLEGCLKARGWTAQS